VCFVGVFCVCVLCMSFVGACFVRVGVFCVCVCVLCVSFVGVCVLCACGVCVGECMCVCCA
jgi:hypothetical protein